MRVIGYDSARVEGAGARVRAARLAGARVMQGTRQFLRPLAIVCEAIAAVCDDGISRVEHATGAAVGGVARPAARLARPWVGRIPVPQPVLRTWRWLVAHVTAEWLVALLASGLSVGFYAWYANQGLTLAYGDAVSHMMIARRVVAGLTPGLAQLGTTWLPLNHALMLPLIWNDTLWRDGFAGAFPSMIAFVISSLYTLRLGRLMMGSIAAGWVAALAFMLNPNILYMQSTPMSEMDLICAALLAIYYVARWSQTFRTTDLVKAAAACAAGTMIRYDGWALVAALAVIVVYVSWRERGRTYAESNFILFATLGFSGCIAWLIYNQAIFGNALEFYNGPFTAKAQQQQIVNRGGLPTLHNLGLSLHVYAQAALDSVWWPIALGAIVGVVCWIFRARLRLATLPMYALLVPFAFNWLSLVMGISIVQTPEVRLDGNATYFNERYGMMMIPAFALFLAFLALQRRTLLIITLGLLILVGVPLASSGTPYVLQDPLHGTERVLAPEAGDWLHAHYTGGNILISYSPFAPTMFYTNLPDRDFITDSNQPEFNRTLAHPEEWTAWIVVDQGNVADPVWTALNNRSDWRAHYILRHVIGTVQFYERVDMLAGSPPESALLTSSTGSSANQPDIPVQADIRQAPPSSADVRGCVSTCAS